MKFLCFVAFCHRQTVYLLEVAAAYSSSGYNCEGKMCFRGTILYIESNVCSNF